MRLCKCCGLEKEETEFQNKNKSKCKNCFKEYNKQYYNRKPEKFLKSKEKSRQLYEKNKETYKRNAKNNRTKKGLRKLARKAYFKVIKRNMHIQTISKDCEFYINNDVWAIDDCTKMYFDLRGFPIYEDSPLKLTDYAKKLINYQKL